MFKRLKPDIITRHILAICLSLSMIATPITVFAEDTDLDTSTESAETPPDDESTEKVEQEQDNSVITTEPVGIAQELNIFRKSDSRTFEPYHTIEKNDKLVSSNARLELYINEQSFVLKVKDKQTNYVWSSAVPKDMLQGMSIEWQRIAQSMVVVDVFASNGSSKRSPIKHGSVEPPTITYADDGFTARLEFFEAKLQMDLNVKLTENGIKVSIPDDSFEIKGGNSIANITVMPFFGATYKDTIPGYIFVPDGIGALMRFEQPRSYSSPYRERIYGSDQATTNANSYVANQSNAVAPEKISMPVFGMVHGERQQGFMASITSGDTYCDLNASPAGVIVDYFWAAPTFVYRENYWQSTTGVSGFAATQSVPNVVNPEIEYRLLSNDQASYTGMANEYKKVLQQQGWLNSEPTLQKVESVPIKLDALMSEPTKGLIGISQQDMTEVSDILRWVDELKSNGIVNPIISLMGYEKGGYNAAKLVNVSFDNSIGNSKEIEQLSDAVDSNLVLQKNIFSGYGKQILKSNLRYGMDGRPITQSEYKRLFNEQTYASDTSLKQSADKLIAQTRFDNIALDDMGNMLFSDYNRSNPIQREQSKQAQMEVAKKISDSKGGLSLAMPGAYLYSSVDSIYSVPLTGSGYAYFSETVPFLPIVLSGYAGCYSDYQNFSANLKKDILSLIDFNMLPSYILTEEYANKLTETNMDSIYSSRFDDWKARIIDSYKTVNDVLSQVYGSEIVDREHLKDGVTKNMYNNGKYVIVNYTSKPYNYDGYNVDGQSAVVGKGK